MVIEKLVILKFGQGSFEKGFTITVQIGNEGSQPYLSTSGELPPASIDLAYQEWQQSYRKMIPSIQLTNDPDQTTNVSSTRISGDRNQTTNFSDVEDCKNKSRELRVHLNNWLRSGLFLPIRDFIIEKIQRDDNVRFLIQTENKSLQRLPWQICDLFTRFSRAGVGICPPDYIMPPVPVPRSPVRILAILGSNTGIDVEADRLHLQKLTHAKVTFLLKPEKQTLYDLLWQEHWDILFFAGHSSSYAECGRIYINDTESLTIEDLHYPLKAAVAKGLKLAIFNSCDGLELARSLFDLHISQIIVMREPVPDIVAQEFLKYLLSGLSKLEPLHLAVRHAREQLQWLEKDCPCATWLPTIFQNPDQIPDLIPIPVPIPPKKSIWQLWKKWGKMILLAFLCIGVAIAIHAINLPKALNKPILSSNLPSESLAERRSLGGKYLITCNPNVFKEQGAKAYADGKYSEAISNFGLSLKLERNDPETRIYLNNANVATQKNLRIAASVPISQNSKISEEMLRGIAQSQYEINRDGGIHGMMLQVEIANDENNKDIAKALAKAFVSDPHIVGVIGHNASEVTLAAAPIYQKEKLVAISPTSGAQELEEYGDYVFRTVPSNVIDAQNLAKYIVTKQKKRVGFCIDSESTYSNSLERVFKRLISDKRLEISQIPCDFSKSLNSDNVISQMGDNNKKVDTLLIVPSVKRLYKGIKMAKLTQGNFLLLGGSTTYTNDLLKLGGGSVNGMVMSVVWHPSVLPGSPFLSKANEIWGDASINWRTAMSYDATQAIAQGLKNINPPDAEGKISDFRKDLQKALSSSSSSFSADGATGKFKFREKTGDRDGEGILVQVKSSNKSDTGYGFFPIPISEYK